MARATAAAWLPSMCVRTSRAATPPNDSTSSWLVSSAAPLMTLMKVTIFRPTWLAAASLVSSVVAATADDDRAAKAVDRAVAELVGDVDSARNEVDELKRARDADLLDAKLQQKKFEQQLETVRNECTEKIGQVVEATRAARAALDDARAASRSSLDTLRTELYTALDQRSDDWRDDRADLVRGLARCDRAIGCIEGKLDVAKTTARAFAEEAPAVKRAGELSGKVESVDARVDAIDAKIGRFKDAERRSASDRARLDALETWQRGDASEAFEHLAALDAAAELQRDVLPRVGRLEEASTSYRAALGELAPQRLTQCEEKLSTLKQALDDNERAARDRGRELESALGDARDALETNLVSFGRRVDEGAARAAQAADAAEQAREIADAVPKRVDAVRDSFERRRPAPPAEQLGLVVLQGEARAAPQRPLLGPRHDHAVEAHEAACATGGRLIILCATLSVFDGESLLKYAGPRGGMTLLTARG